MKVGSRILKKLKPTCRRMEELLQFEKDRNKFSRGIDSAGTFKTSCLRRF